MTERTHIILRPRRRRTTIPHQVIGYLRVDSKFAVCSAAIFFDSPALLLSSPPGRGWGWAWRGIKKLTVKMHLIFFYRFNDDEH